MPQKRPFRQASQRNQSALGAYLALLSCGGLVLQGVTEMGYVLLQGLEPFDLIAQRLPSVLAINGLLAATVQIHAPRFPGNTADVRILLNPEQAEDLARQLLLEAKNARERP